jgi:hypothetical protein
MRLMALAGLRRGEAIGLRWTDVDLERQVITVVQPVVQFGHKRQIGPPKTKTDEQRQVDRCSPTGCVKTWSAPNGATLGRPGSTDRRNTGLF